MVPRTKEESIRLLGRGTRGAAKRPQTAPGPYNARVQTSSGLRASHGNQSHFPYYVRESGQGLRGLCPQGEPRRAVRVHRGRGAAVRRALLGGSRPRGGAHQGRVSRREAHLPAAACDPAHRRGEEARRGQDHRDGRRQRHGGTVPGADVFDAARREEVKQPSGILGIAGTAALSPFRGPKLLERLRAIEPAVTALDSRFMHFVECTRALTAGERAVLLALLTYGPRPQAPPPAGEGAANRVLVVPRAGTISPWSSKATDIARVCGLEPVRRIERGIEYRLEAPRPLGAARLAALAPALFDRMTEMALLEASEVARLFVHDAPRPLERVPLAAGRAALVEADRARGLALSAEEIDYLLELPGRLHRLRRRDPGRGGHGARREAEGRAHRLLGVAPAHPGLRAGVGARVRRARAHRLPPRHHDRGSDRRRLVQQRVRASGRVRLLPHLRAARRRRSPAAHARLSQADHDRRGSG